MAKQREYLVTRYAPNGEKLRELRVPKTANPKQLLERLICQDLDDETIIASCLRKNSKRAYDPFQIIDMRDEHRREKARSVLASAPLTANPIDVYNNARAANIELGKILMIAGVSRDFFLKEVEV